MSKSSLDGSGFRGKSIRLKTAKGRKNSSTRWLQRQINDPYVQRAKALGYRSRAEFKLIELDEKYNLFKKGQRVLDLGAAPGGWSEYAAKMVNSSDSDPLVLGVDLKEIDFIPGTKFIVQDFLDDDAPSIIKSCMSGEKFDIVLSDMAPNACGHRQTDHLRIMALVELAYDFSKEVLKNGGTFVAKVLQGGTEAQLLKELKRSFAKVVHAKPSASRKDSSEMYVVCQGFRGCNNK